MTFLGSRLMNESLSFEIITHDPATGEPANADDPPAYRLYRDDSDTPLLIDAMTQRDIANVTGWYGVTINLDAGSGFAAGYNYAIVILATVNGINGSMLHAFSIQDSIWNAPVRTLTQSAAQIVAAVASPSSIMVLRGDSLLVPITGLGDLSSYTSIDFTAKYDERDSDAMAILRIRNNATSTDDGLLRLNGLPALNAADGAITITDSVNGDISISLVAADVAALPVGTWSFDIQMITASDVVTLSKGLFVLSPDITRAVS
jgi:hypothetical protein